ncbi:MAG: adenylate/guanylate cyclase domain-containing protein [Thermomicrobiales bacterium]
MTAIESERQTHDEPADTSTPPTGLVTFLFTDIEGSTKLWEQYPQAMRSALARHDAILRQAIEENRGYVFKTIGDAFCAAFPSAVEALTAVLTAQRSLAKEPWGETGPLRARMALNTGEAEFRENDYFGPPVNRTARLLAVGHGGQVLLSASTQEHLLEELPKGVELRDLGKHRLKDIGQKEPIAQCLAPDLPAVFPKLRTPPSPVPGAIAAIAVAFIGLNLFAVASGGADLGPSLLSPKTLLESLTGMVVSLSVQRQTTLLLLAGLLFVATLVVIGLWWRGGRIRAGRFGLASRLAGRHVGLRTATFFVIATLVVLGAYGYQEYKWHKLQVPSGKLGLAITRSASAQSLGQVNQQFEDGLKDTGQQVVVHELPVNFNSKNRGEAKLLGKRIGADAVFIYREDASNSDGLGSYIGSIVFTKPLTTSTFGGTGAVSTAAVDSEELPSELEAGVSMPTVRARTRAEVGSDFVSAAAGIIAYDKAKYAVAIALLKQAHPEDLDAPNSGIVNYYLGLAYRMNGGQQDQEAKAVQEQAIKFYEQRLQKKGELSTQDKLVLVKAYAERCYWAGLEDDWDGAIAWCEKGKQYRDSLLAKADALGRPAEVQMTYYWLYSLLADAYGAKNKPEDQKYWQTRADTEAQDLGLKAKADDPYPLIYQARARLYAGDCVTGVDAINRALALNPTDPRLLRDAHNNLGILYHFQGRGDLAEQEWLKAAAIAPNDIASRGNLADLMMGRAIPMLDVGSLEQNLDALMQGKALSPGNGIAEQYIDLTYLTQAEDYYHQILAIDPANQGAHAKLAGLAWWRAQTTAIYDLTAFISGDDLASAKSQGLWRTDPGRVQSALDSYGESIQERRTLVTELRPDDSQAKADVATAYEDRAELLYSELLTYSIYGPAPPEQNADWASQTGSSLLNDTDQVREWSEKVASDSKASRLAKLTAWKARTSALEREWSWYYFNTMGNDPSKAASVETEYRQAVKDAVAFVESAPMGNNDEIAPARGIYFEAKYLAQVDGDQAAATGYQKKINDLTAQETTGYATSTAHIANKCKEVAEQVAGDDKLAKRDAKSAQRHYEAALAINPHHVPSLLGLAKARQAQNDIPGAIAKAQAATQESPNDPAAWELLAYGQLLSGDVEVTGASYDRFLSAVAPLPSQERMASFKSAIDDLRKALDANPKLAPRVITVVPRFAAVLDGMTGDGAGAYQYPALYAQLGALALYAGNAAMAEPLLAKAVGFDKNSGGSTDCDGSVPTTCDSHQPVAWVDLIAAAIAQGGDGKAELDAAMKETESGVWNYVDGYDPATLLKKMQAEADAYVKRFPDQKPVAVAVKEAISVEPDRQAQAALVRNGVNDKTYASPGYDTRLKWDATWSAGDASRSGPTDSLTLVGGQSVVRLETSAIYGGDPSACLSQEAESRKAQFGDPSFAPAKLASGKDAQAETANDAWGVYAYQQADDAGVMQNYVLYLECRVLEPGKSGIQILWLTDTANFDQERERVSTLLGSLQPAKPVSLPVLDLPSAATMPGITGNSYTSPSYRYQWSWDSTWTVNTSTSQDGNDALVLTNGQSFASVEGFVDPSQSPNTCLRAAAKSLATTATIHDIIVVKGTDGKPLHGTDAIGTFAVFTYTLDQAGGRTTNGTLYVTCGPVGTDGGIVRFEYFSPKDQFDAEAEKRDQLLKELVLPAQKNLLPFA